MIIYYIGDEYNLIEDQHLTIQTFVQFEKTQSNMQGEKYQEKTKKINHINAENNANNQQKNFLSPKLLRRKSQNRPKQINKNRNQIPEMFCYISPTKTLDKLNAHSSSTTSLVSLCGSPRSGFINCGSSMTESIRQNQWDEMTDFQYDQQLVQKNKELGKKVKDYEGKISRLEEENNYCLSQIEQLSYKLSEKDQLLKDYKNDLTKLQKQYQQQREIKNRQIIVLEDKIYQLSKLLNEKSAIMSLSDDTDDGQREMINVMELQTQLQQHRQKNMRLLEKIKYFEIQQHIYQKLLADYQEQQNKNEKLKGINRILTRRVQRLQQMKKKARTRRDKSISFELSVSR